MDSFLLPYSAMAVLGFVFVAAFWRRVIYLMVRLFRNGNLSPQRQAAILNGLGRVSVSSLAHAEPAAREGLTLDR